jgi:hypothetical protein
MSRLWGRFDVPPNWMKKMLSLIVLTLSAIKAQRDAA